MNKPLNLGIIGAGYWARSAHLPSVASDPRVRWQAVANRRIETARAMAEAFAIPEATDDWRALLARSDIDAVVVTTPANTHYEIAMAAIAAGKHLLCEGTLAMTLAEARQMADAADAADLVHAYIRPRPYLYGGDQVREVLASGRLGRLQSGLLCWRGNPWLKAMPADTWRVRAEAAPPVVVCVPLAIAVDLFGPIDSVRAATDRLFIPEGVDPAVLAPDYFEGSLTTRSGLRLVVQAGHSSHDGGWSGLQIFGSKGMLCWDWEAPGEVRVGSVGADSVESIPLPPKEVLAEAWPYTREFVEAILTGKRSRPDFHDGVRELAVIEAALLSAASGEARSPDR